MIILGLVKELLDSDPLQVDEAYKEPNTLQRTLDRNMEYGIWNMEYGIWNMEYGIWKEYGIWNMEYGIWNMENEFRPYQPEALEPVQAFDGG